MHHCNFNIACLEVLFILLFCYFVNLLFALLFAGPHSSLVVLSKSENCFLCSAGAQESAAHTLSCSVGMKGE